MTTPIEYSFKTDGKGLAGRAFFCYEDRCVSVPTAQILKQWIQLQVQHPDDPTLQARFACDFFMRRSQRTEGVLS